MPNPYFSIAKAAVEKLLFDVADCQTNKEEIQKSNGSGWRIARLGSILAAGAHCSGLIGESPKISPNNPFPMICRVAVDKIRYLRSFGDDWPTPDGTGIRDYIHVIDLASVMLQHLIIY